MKPASMSDDFDDLLQKAVAAIDALSPQQRAAHVSAQRESWVRGEMAMGEPSSCSQRRDHLFDARALWELACKQDRIEELEGLLGLHQPILMLPRVGRHGRAIFGMLMAAKGAVSLDAMVTAIYGAKPDCDWPQYPGRCLNVAMVRLRAALHDYGIKIVRLDGAGYALSPEMKAKARAAGLIGGAA